MEAGKAKHKRFKSAERREQVLDAARSLFAKQGFRETTLNQVAASVGVTRARVLQLCGSKDELYKAIVQSAYREHPLDKDLEVPIESSDDFGVLQSFALHILDNYANPADREILTILMYSRLREDEFSKEHFFKKDTLMISRLIYWISQRIAQGRFKRMDPQVAVTAFQAMVVNLAVYKHVLGQLEFVDNQELARNCADIFLNGLVKQSKAPNDQSPGPADLE